MRENETHPLESELGIRSISSQLDILDDRFRLIEQIDQQTTEMVARLAEAVRASAEARAQASLAISVSLGELASALDDRQNRHFGVLAGLSEEITIAKSEAESLREVVLQLELRLSSSLDQLAGDRGETKSPISEVVNPPQVATTSNCVSVIIEAVPNAVTALAIQHLIAAIPNVISTTARTFEEGVLCFDLQLRDGNIDLHLAAESAGGLAVIERRAHRDRYTLVHPERLFISR